MTLGCYYYYYYYYYYYFRAPNKSIPVTPPTLPLGKK